MLGSSVIVFREVLEAALIVTIVLAATRGVRLRGFWVGGGLVAGILGAVLVAFSTDAISSMMEGLGQEIFNAAVLVAAVLMLAWHNIWMSAHGRELATRMKSIGLGVGAGELPMFALTSAVTLAVLREGSEVVLFLNGMAMSGESTAALIGGAALGVAGGGAVGVAMYFGLLRVPLRYFFQVTGWMILLLAAGLGASAAGFLEQAGVLPALDPLLWDSSWLLSERSLAGQLAHTLVGYQARPSGIAVFAWILTFGTILVLMKTISTGKANRAARPVDDTPVTENS
ncbi:MAG TPA: FTR1 family protein [Gammaproteobacteria bacterium]|nr:FTR1 family protein [Gammaproteobacteria bacterium]